MGWKRRKTNIRREMRKGRRRKGRRKRKKGRRKWRKWRGQRCEQRSPLFITNTPKQ
jgi:hypothetical protein